MEIKIKYLFGEFCARGGLAIDYINCEVIPNLNEDEDLVVDLEGVRNMNSSFCNAFFSNLFIKYGDGLKGRIRVVNARESLKGPIRASMAQGLEKYYILHGQNKQ